MRPWPLEAALLFPYVPFLGPFPSCKRLLCTAPIRKEQEREEETANVNMIHLNAGPSRPRQVDHGGRLLLSLLSLLSFISFTKEIERRGRDSTAVVNNLLFSFFKK